MLQKSDTFNFWVGNYRHRNPSASPNQILCRQIWLENMSAGPIMFSDVPFSGAPHKRCKLEADEPAGLTFQARLVSKQRPQVLKAEFRVIPAFKCAINTRMFCLTIRK